MQKCGWKSVLLSETKYWRANTGWGWQPNHYSCTNKYTKDDPLPCAISEVKCFLQSACNPYASPSAMRNMNREVNCSCSRSLKKRPWGHARPGLECYFTTIVWAVLYLLLALLSIAASDLRHGLVSQNLSSFSCANEETETERFLAMLFG